MAYIQDLDELFIEDFAGGLLEDLLPGLELATGMSWDTQKTRIRRFLRDPNENIWSDDFLLNMFNDEQFELQNKAGSIEDVRMVQIPPRMQSCYLWDWEWPYNDSDNGEVFQMGYYNDENQYICTNLWEMEHLAELTPTTAAHGGMFTHPWEYWEMSAAAEPPPISFPSGFYRAKFLAWDKKPIEAITLRELQDRDFTWKTRTGLPEFYHRDEKLSNRFFLYPTPNSVTWVSGQTVDADPDEAAYASSSLNVDNNLLIVFDKDPTQATGTDSTSDFPAYLRKYIEYGVIARAYGANTDGRIPSLSEYWRMRKKVGQGLIERYLSNRRSDRQYQLNSSGAPRLRSVKHPRMPSAFASLSAFEDQ